MKSTSTTSESVCMGSLIYPLGVTVFPSKLTKGESYAVKSLSFRFSPLYRSGYITFIALPWFTNTLFTSNPSNPKCNYQSIIMGLDGSNLILVRESQHRWGSLLRHFGFPIIFLSGEPSHRHYPRGKRVGSSRSGKDDIYRTYGRSQRYVSSRFLVCLAQMTAGRM